jgi:hypothetical protein
MAEDAPDLPTEPSSFFTRPMPTAATMQKATTSARMISIRG